MQRQKFYYIDVFTGEITMQPTKHTTQTKEINMAKLLFPEESNAIVDACFEVYEDKGYGFWEAVYQECLFILFVSCISWSEFLLAETQKLLRASEKVIFHCALFLP